MDIDPNIKAIVTAAFKDDAKSVVDLFDKAIKDRLGPAVEAGKTHIATNLFHEPIQEPDQEIDPVDQEIEAEEEEDNGETE